MNPQDFLGPTFERRVAYGQAGTACVTESDLQRLIQHLVMDTHSIRIALASAVHQVLYGGHELPTSDYMQNLIENMLFDDIMGAAWKFPTSGRDPPRGAAPAGRLHAAPST